MVNIVLKDFPMVDQVRNLDTGSKAAASLASVVRLARVNWLCQVGPGMRFA